MANADSSHDVCKCKSYTHNAPLLKLVERFMHEKTLRDGGYTAKQTYREIRDLASPEELIQILEEAADVL